MNVSSRSSLDEIPKEVSASHKSFLQPNSDQEISEMRVSVEPISLTDDDEQAINRVS